MTTTERSARGVTIVELLVAITVAAMVASVVLTVYTGTAGFFSRRGHDASELAELILAQKRTDAACRSLSLLVRCNEREVVARTSGGDATLITLHFDGAVLTAGADTLVTRLEEFRFSLVENRERNDTRTAVLMWEGLYGKKRWWLGGAVTLAK